MCICIMYPIACLHLMSCQSVAMAQNADGGQEVIYEEALLQTLKTLWLLCSFNSLFTL